MFLIVIFIFILQIYHCDELYVEVDYLCKLYKLYIEYMQIFNGIGSKHIEISRFKTSVADPVFLGHPDPDPGKYRIRILIHKKTLGILIFSLHKT